MKRSTALTMFLSGVLLYSAAVYIGGYLAAIAIPHAYFELFGANKTLALVVEEAVVYALPIFLLAAAWGYASIRPLKGSHRKATLWCLAGVVAGWLGWIVHSLAHFTNNPQPNQFSLGTLALLLIIPPVWGVLNVAAAPSGVVFGGWLAGRSNPAFKRTPDGAA